MSLLKRWQETSWYSALGAKVAVALLATAAAVLLNAGSSWAQVPTSTSTSTPTPPGFLEICKETTGSGLTGNFTFTVAPASGPTQTVTVPVGSCSSALQLASGNATITETGPTFENEPSFTLTSVTAVPAGRLVSQNLTARSAVVTIVAGDITTETRATFTNQPITGQIKVCKVASAGVAVGRNFTFTVSPAPSGPSTITVPAGAAPAGTCDIFAGTFNVGSQITVQETIPSGTNVVAITVNPSGRLVGAVNLPAGQAIIRVGSGITEVTFTDASAPTLTSTPTPTSTRTPTATLTTPQALAATLTAVSTAVASPTPAGTPGIPCVSQANQVCTISSPFTGGPTGTAANTGNGTFTFNVTATAPTGTVAGDVPLIFISTTVGEESSLNSGFVCSTVTGAGAVTACSGTTRGLILQGAGVLVRFVDTTVIDLAGNAFGCATACAQVGVVPPPPPPPSGLPFSVPQVGIPAVPRPPVQFIPPAPAPLLPPQAPIGSLQQGVSGAPMAPPRYPEVPVIPEGDSVALILGGLGALGAVALYRRRRA